MILSTLDLSFNLIKSVPEALAHLPSLKTVFFVQNRISHISGLDKCLNLTSLELGSNRIRVSNHAFMRGFNVGLN